MAKTKNYETLNLEFILINSEMGFASSSTGQNEDFGFTEGSW